MSENARNTSYNQTIVYKDAFGLGRVICIVLVPIFIGLEAVDKPRIQG